MPGISSQILTNAQGQASGQSRAEGRRLWGGWLGRAAADSRRESRQECSRRSTLPVLALVGDFIHTVPALWSGLTLRAFSCVISLSANLSGDLLFYGREG